MAEEEESEPEPPVPVIVINPELVAIDTVPAPTILIVESVNPAKLPMPPPPEPHWVAVF